MDNADLLRPIERVVLRGLTEGQRVDELAVKLRRSPAHVGRIAEWATLKLRIAERREEDRLRWWPK